jgi:beta-hydroxylase
MAENCRRCPETARLVEAVPGMKTAFFSMLGPRKSVPAHRGPWRGVLRYHLALVVPEPRAQCGIRVADQIGHWQEGKSLVFDDAYEHEVFNHTDGRRVVLFMDIVRPLRFPFSAANTWMIERIARSEFLSQLLNNQARWAAGRGKDVAVA